VVRYQQGRHARLIHANADAVAGDAGLRHLEKRAADAITVANADFIVGQAVNGEILAELAKGEVASSELFFPVVVGVYLINENGALLPAMTGEIALAVTVNVQPPDRAPALDRALPHRRVYGFSFPGDVARETNVD